MDLREFMRFHLLKALLGLVVIQIIIVAIVQNYNHRPVTQPDKATVVEGRTIRVTPLSNDSDKDDKDELSVHQVFQPVHGKIEQKANLLFYTPDAGFVGLDSLTYTISDGRKESKPGTIVIEVTKNLEPVTNPDIAEVYSGEAVTINVLSNDSDREGDSIFIKEFTQPAQGKLIKEGNNLIYQAGKTSSVADSFNYVATDGKSNSALTAVRITIKSKNDPCYPWLSSNVGDAALPGSFSCINKTMVVEGSGSDIWNAVDGFRYVYQAVGGDCEMGTKVDSLIGTEEWSKAGLMIRQSLDGGSPCAFVCVTTRNGVTYQQRVLPSEGTDGGTPVSEAKAPYWLKISRKGNAFAYLISKDGIKWDSLGNAEINMPKNVYIGFAVTSHNNQEISKAVFSHYQLTGKKTSLNMTN